MELIIVALISTAGFLIGLIYLDKSFYRRLQWKKNYEESMIKLKKKEARKDKKIAAEIRTKAPAGAGDILTMIKNMDRDKLSDIMGFLSGEEEELPSGIGGMIEEFISKNPELAMSFLQGFLNKGKEEQSDNFFNR